MIYNNYSVPSTLSIDHSDYFWSRKKNIKNTKLLLRNSTWVLKKKKRNQRNTYNQAKEKENRKRTEAIEEALT